MIESLARVMLFVMSDLHVSAQQKDPRERKSRVLSSRGETRWYGDRLAEFFEEKDARARNDRLSNPAVGLVVNKLDRVFEPGSPELEVLRNDPCLLGPISTGGRSVLAGLGDRIPRRSLEKLSNGLFRPSPRIRAGIGRCAFNGFLESAPRSSPVL